MKANRTGETLGLPYIPQNLPASTPDWDAVVEQLGNPNVHVNNLKEMVADFDKNFHDVWAQKTA